MKKFLLLLIIAVTNIFPALADDYVLKGSTTLNWDNISQQERENSVEQIKTVIFGNTSKEKKLKDFKLIYKDYLKDKNYKKHYLVASSGYKEYKEYNISAMYYKKMSTVCIYALQPKKNPSTIYYYDALGNLRYLDNIKGDYPKYPYYTEQYKRSGKLAGISYFSSKDTQYIFNPDGEFKGVWHRENFYDLKGEIRMKRSNY